MIFFNNEIYVALEGPEIWKSFLKKIHKQQFISEKDIEIFYY